MADLKGFDLIVVLLVYLHSSLSMDRAAWGSSVTQSGWRVMAHFVAD